MLQSSMDGFERLLDTEVGNAISFRSGTCQRGRFGSVRELPATKWPGSLPGPRGKSRNASPVAPGRIVRRILREIFNGVPTAAREGVVSDAKPRHGVRSHTGDFPEAGGNSRITSRLVRTPTLNAQEALGSPTSATHPPRVTKSQPTASRLPGSVPIRLIFAPVLHGPVPPNGGNLGLMG